jgi:molybdenum cofactor cytidylyltransferase
VLVPRVAAILLAAGGSARMGRRKQLLAWQGRTLLRRAAETAVEAGCSPIVVVLGCEAERMAPELSGLPVAASVNIHWERGIGSSIKHGAARLLELSPAVDAAMILLSDQPLVNPQTLRALIGEFARSEKPACGSAYADTIGPPVVVGRPCFPQLLALPDSQGAKAIWSGRPDAIALYQCDEAATDVDTPADYARLEFRSQG